MPELPEVETIKLGLSKKIIGQKIKTIRILNPKTFQDSDGKPFDFAQGLHGKVVLNIWRKAKVLGIDLEGNLTLLFHLKMSGQLIYIPSKTDHKSFIGGHPTPEMSGEMPVKSTRVIFEFDDGSKLYFNDQRKFGWIRVVKSSELRDQSFLRKLGPEPLEKGFTWKTLKSSIVNHKSQPVKVAIMDQSVVAGVGNIYASEACFIAGIDPRTKVGELNDLQFKKLHQGIIQSLKAGIKYGGSTKTHFVNAEGKKGYFLDYAFVYGRDQDICKKCGNLIHKIKLGGRGTYFCAHCQH